MTPTPPKRSRGRGAIWPLAALALGLSAATQAAESVPADRVKATFLYKFVPFVEWPGSTFPGPASPVTVCIVGDDPLGPALEREMAAEHIGPRPIVVRTMPLARPHSGCQVMYLSGSEVQSIGQALRIVRGEPVLTVTDDAAAKGIVDFTIVGGRVRFRIDQQGAAANGLGLRSTLLALAVSVARGQDGR